MKLNIFERINLLSILPMQGDFMTLKIIRQLREGLSFTEEEHKVLKFKQLDDGRVSWDAKATKEKDIRTGNKARSIIREVLEGLNKEKKLRDEHFTLYEKFIEKR